MSAVHPSPRECSDWRSLYLAAVFETNKHHVALRIHTAEKAIAERSRELFASRDYDGERHALQSASVGLRALGMCVQDESVQDREAA